MSEDKTVEVPLSFYLQVVAMRAHQVEFFRTRNKHVLSRCKDLEKSVDYYIDQHRQKCPAFEQTELNF